MDTVIKRIPIPADLESEIAREAGERGKSWAVLGKELLVEAIRMRRVPGVAFADGPAGRRAVVAGTGLDVWELIATWKECNQDDQAFHHSYPWLTESQRRAALTYYRRYPQEIEERLERERRWTPERVWSELPFSMAGKHK